MVYHFNLLAATLMLYYADSTRKRNFAMFGLNFCFLARIQLVSAISPCLG